METFKIVWKHGAIKNLVWKIAEKNHPLYDRDDLKQDCFLHIWETIELKGRFIYDREAYIFTSVTKCLLGIMKKIAKDEKHLQGSVFIDASGDVLSTEGRYEPVDRKLLWSGLTVIDSSVMLREVITAITKITLTSAKRRNAFEDLLEVSGARGEPSPAALERCAETKSRSVFRAVCVANGLSKKEQEMFRADLRIALKSIRRSARRRRPRKKASPVVSVIDSQMTPRTTFGPPPQKDSDHYDLSRVWAPHSIFSLVLPVRK